MVELLIKNGADVNIRDESGSSPLHNAIMTYLSLRKNSCDKTVKILVANGAKINIKNNDGLTPVDIARKLGHQEIVELLDNPANIENK